jgi:hypothetical protein
MLFLKDQNRLISDDQQEPALVYIEQRVACSVTGWKRSRFLHYMPVIIAQKLSIGLII